MVDFNTCQETAAGNIRTPKARMSYPNLMTPNSNAKTKDGKEKYTVSILIPPTANIDLLKKAAGDAAKEKFGDKAGSLNLKTPFLDAFEKSKTEKNPSGDEQFKGWTLIRATSLQKPGIVDHMAQAVDDSSQVYPGRWAVFSLRPFAYSMDGNKGVSFGVQNVQLLDHDTPLAGSAVRAEDEFAPVEGAGGDDGGEETGGKSADSVFG